MPYLTVKVTERQNYVEDVNYDVNYVSDSSMYQGDERVISKGSFGKADIVADVTYINGEEQERTVISSVTLSDPVAETRARGTKVRPTWYPTAGDTAEVFVSIHMGCGQASWFMEKKAST